MVEGEKVEIVVVKVMAGYSGAVVTQVVVIGAAAVRSTRYNMVSINIPHKDLEQAEDDFRTKTKGIPNR
nr:hypothetical protein [Tanacetum cinerariifolium]